MGTVAAPAGASQAADMTTAIIEGFRLCKRYGSSRGIDDLTLTSTCWRNDHNGFSHWGPGA